MRVPAESLENPAIALASSKSTEKANLKLGLALSAALHQLRSLLVMQQASAEGSHCGGFHFAPPAAFPLTSQATETVGVGEIPPIHPAATATDEFDCSCPRLSQ